MNLHRGSGYHGVRVRMAGPREATPGMDRAFPTWQSCCGIQPAAYQGPAADPRQHRAAKVQPAPGVHVTRACEIGHLGQVAVSGTAQLQHLLFTRSSAGLALPQGPPAGLRTAAMPTFRATATLWPTRHLLRVAEHKALRPCGLSLAWGYRFDSVRRALSFEHFMANCQACCEALEGSLQWALLRRRFG